MPQIQYKDPESEKIVSIDIDAGMPVITIGRNPGNVIRVNNPSISRQHAKIVWENDACTLIDLDSSNGSYVNGQQIKSQLLTGNDRLRVGEFPLDYLIEASEPLEAMENDIVSMSHEDIDIGDILSSDDVDEALSEAQSDSEAFDSLGKESSISSISSVSFAEDPELPPMAPPVESVSFLESEFEDDNSLAEVSAIEPVMIYDPDLTGGEIDVSLVHHSPTRLEVPPLVAEFPPPPADLPPPPADLPPQSNATAVEVDTTEFELRINELMTERDELLDLLQSRAGDAGGAAKVQIDRLRAERDRLIEERRNLQRTQRDLRTQLDAFPPIEEMEAFNEELSTLRDKDLNHETRVGTLQSEIDMHLETIESLNIKSNENLTTIEGLQNTVAENENLAQNLEAAKAEIENFDIVKSQLEEKISNLLNDGATSADRDQQHLVRIEQLEDELETKTGVISGLEEDKQALMKRSLELDELSEEYKSVQLELQARPVAEEVQAIIADLASARATIENNDQTIEELEIQRTSLTERLETADHAQTQFDVRFDKQGEELAEVQRTYLALKKEKEAFARETDYLMGAKRNYDSEIRSAQKQVQELEKNDRRKKKIFDELRSDLEVLIGENTILQTSLDGLQNQLESAPSSEDLEASISLSKERIEEIAGLKLTVSDLEDELENQTKLVKSEQTKLEATNEKLNESQIELEALRVVVSDESNSASQNTELSEIISENAKAIKDLQKELEGTTSKLEKRDAEVTELKGDNKALKKELTTLKKKGTSAEKENQTKIEKLEKQIAEAEEALSEIILEKDRLEDEIAAK